MFQRVVCACLLAIALTACAAGPALFGPSTGTVNGHLQLRACGGAYLPEQTGCPVRPMPGATLTFEPSGGSSSSTVTTDSTGAYRIDLKPGAYSVRVTEMGSATLPKPGAFADKSAGLRGFAGPGTVTVDAGKTVTADYTYTIQMM